MQSNTVAHMRAARIRLHNRAAISLFLRGAYATMIALSIAIGFLAGIELERSHYHATSGVAALLALTCATLTYVLMRRRGLLKRLKLLEVRVEELTDAN